MTKSLRYSIAIDVFSPAPGRGQFAVGVGGDLLLVSLSSDPSDGGAAGPLVPGFDPSRSPSRKDSSSQSITDKFAERGPFSAYMSHEGDDQIDDLGTTSGMQPQGQRSPEIIHDLNGKIVCYYVLLVGL